MGEQALTPNQSNTLSTTRWLPLARLSWLILAAAALTILIAALPRYLTHLTDQLTSTTANALASLFSTFACLTLAIFLFRRKFNEPIAILLSFFLLLYGIVLAGPLEHAVFYWLDRPSIYQAAQAFLLFTPLIALLFLFPTGRFPLRWTRWALLLTLPANILMLLLLPFEAETLATKPFLATITTCIILSYFILGIYMQIYRYRYLSAPLQQKQMRWAIYGFTLWILYIVISSIPYFYLSSLPPNTPFPWWASLSTLGWWLSHSILPISLTISITRYQLWDIDLVINRTLVYGALTAIVLALYALIVGGMSLLFRTDDNFLFPLLATGFAVLLFHPLRNRLQQAINRFMYGERDEPFEVLARLGERLEGALSPEMVYPTIVETVSQTLKLPYTAVTVHHNGRFETVQAHGRPPTDPITYPLTYQGETVGQLIVSPRAKDEPFSPADERILRNIARQAGAAVHAVQLMADLQQSRQQIITAREEERRRLRRDLHDGLGAALAALNLEAGVLRRSIRTNPDKAEQLAEELKAEIKGTIDEIRRLVYELRPPTLDQLGLVMAIRLDANQCSKKDKPLQIELDAPEKLPPLPAAVEVAAYRIVQEALTNIVRHAQATHGRINLILTANTLAIEISDNGVGIQPADKQKGGLGLLSMRERALELGGQFTIKQAAGGGTHIHATLPLLEVQ